MARLPGCQVGPSANPRPEFNIWLLFAFPPEKLLNLVIFTCNGHYNCNYYKKTREYIYKWSNNIIPCIALANL